MSFVRINKMFKRLAAALTLSALLASSVAGATDEFIFTDPVANTYNGRVESRDLIFNLNFTDVPDDHPNKEAIVRTGALDMLKGYYDKYLPNNYVTNQQAVAFVLRATGREVLAQDTATQLQPTLPAGTDLMTNWSIGYLNVGLQLGLITAQEYADALNPDQAGLNPQTNFIRGGPATRQRVAQWLYQAINTMNAAAFNSPATRQAVYTFNDYDSIDVDKTTAVNAVTRANIMKGDAKNNFRPKSNVTKAEMAQILRDMELIYYNVAGIQKKTGTVGGYKGDLSVRTANGVATRDIYVRTSDGKIDVLRYRQERNSSPQAADYDTVVYNEGKIDGLLSLMEGYQIEYLIQSATNTILYVQVQRSLLTPLKVVGQLKSFNPQTGVITITDPNGNTFDFPVAKGLYGTDGGINYLLMSKTKRDVTKLPFGSNIEMMIKNYIADEINYLGEIRLIDEFRGIVTENNPALGYIVVIDNQGHEQVRFYYPEDVKVYKQQYYDIGDEIGYISQVFPNFRFNPRESSMSEIEPGDIVYIRPDPNDPERLTAISAATNYSMRYGKIRQYTIADGIATMLVEYENKQTAWFDVPTNIYMFRDGRPISAQDVMAGDWAKLLVNQAIISPGHILESVKEMIVEGGGEHMISRIVKGQLAGINAVQNQLQIQNAQTLTGTAWMNYKELQQFSIAAKDIEYYLDGKRITLDYAARNLKRASGEVYVALENSFTGERVRKVTFRSGRDTLLAPDTVVNSNNIDKFSFVTNTAGITTDIGTIVRRYGRLVDGKDIMTADYALVSLNGNNAAAIVDIYDAPGVSGVMIARGRVLSVDEGKSFKVQSMSILSGNNSWNYTPIAREFTIDYNSIFLDENGYYPYETFLGYTENTAIDQVYNIVVDGTRAARVVKAPYPKDAMRGTIYANANGTLSLKTTTYLDPAGKWLSTSVTNATSTVTIPANAIVVKNNNVIPASELQINDQVRILTDKLPEKITSAEPINGYVVLVEK